MSYQYNIWRQNSVPELKRLIIYNENNVMDVGDFHPLEVVHRDSETQPYVGKTFTA